MQTDIVQRIRKHAPSTIDNFAADIERRKNLTDTAIEIMLTKAFDGIDVERLSPELAWRYNRLKTRI